MEGAVGCSATAARAARAAQAPAPDPGTGELVVASDSVNTADSALAMPTQ